eukprot:5755167-Pyramimonas_sp.AAC.2
MAAAESVRAAEGDDLLVVEAHAVEGGAQAVRVRGVHPGLAQVRRGEPPVGGHHGGVRRIHAPCTHRHLSVCRWRPSREYSPSADAIGPRVGNIPPQRTRLAPVSGMFRVASETLHEPLPSLNKKGSCTSI